ncbi:MAG: hypothetical protein ACOYKA_01145 [Legionellaceae bacterium]
MINNKLGFILLTTLMLMSWVSVLVLSLMHAVLVYTKISHRLVLAHEHSYDLERALRVVLKREDSFDSRSCDRGCSLTFHKKKYQYQIKDEGVFPCLHIVDKGLVYSSHHRLVMMYEESFPSTVLKVRITQREQKMPCLLIKARIIPEGIVSWSF